METSEGLMALAEAALNSGDYDSATEKIEKLLESDPKNSKVWYLHGLALLGKADFQITSPQVITRLNELFKQR